MTTTNSFLQYEIVVEQTQHQCQDLFRPMQQLLVLIHHVKDRYLLLTSISRAVKCHPEVPSHPEDHLHLQYRTETTFWILLILTELQLPREAQMLKFRNILQRFNVLYVRNVSQEHITCAPIFGRIQMRDHLFVRFVAKHSQDSTTGSVMKDSTLEKRSLSAKANYQVADHGVVDAGSLELMRLVDISGQKLVEYVSSLY